MVAANCIALIAVSLNDMSVRQLDFSVRLGTPKGYTEANLQLSHTGTADSTGRPIRYGSSNPNWKGGLFKIGCTRCGNVRFVKFSAKEKAKFCSLVCFNKYQKEQGVNYYLAKYGKPQPGRSDRRKKYATLECLWCGKPIEVRPYRLGTRKACSRECYRAYNSWRHSGERNPAWLGGLSSAPYPYDWWKISSRVLERDGRTCRNPNCKHDTKSVDVHHIDYNKMNCSDENLIVLCDRCHSACHAGLNKNREKWEAFYTQLRSEFKSDDGQWKEQAVKS